MNAGRRVRGMRIAEMAPYAVIATVVLVDVLAQSAVLLSLLAAPAGLAAALSRPRAVALVGALAIVVCAGVVLADDSLPSGRRAAALGSVAFVALVAVYTSAVRVRAVERQRRTMRELVDTRAVADVAQGAILGPVPRVIGPFELAVSYTSAAVGARVGGDLYEAVPLPGGGIRLIVGDVQGKGLGAVRTAVTVLTAFRTRALGGGGLREVAQHIEDALGRREVAEEFVTAVLADCGVDGVVTLLNFGHPPPFVRRAGGSVEAAEPEVPGPPLGLPRGLGGYFLDGSGVCSVRLGRGDRLLFYTDGTTEARDAEGVFFGLGEAVRHLGHVDLGVDLGVLRGALGAHVRGPLGDDAALLLLRFVG